MDSQEILFQRKKIIEEKAKIIAPIRAKSKTPVRCNERPGKVKIYSEEEIFLQKLKLLTEAKKLREI